MNKKELKRDVVKRKNVSKLIKNIAWNQIGSGVSITLGFLFQLFILRYFNTKDVASYFLTLSTAYFILLPSTFLLNVFIRYVPFYIGKKEMEKAGKLVFTGSTYVLASSFIMSVGIILFNGVIEANFPGLSGKVWMVAIFSFLLSINTLIRTILASFNKFKKVSIMNSSLSFLKLIVITSFFYFIGGGYIKIMESFFISLIFSSFYGIKELYYETKRMGLPLKLSLEKDETINMVKYSISTFIDNTRTTILSWMDLMFLGYFSTSLDVSGYGGTASFSRTILNLIVGPFFQPLLVKMSEVEGKKIDSMKLFKKSMKYMAIFSSFVGGLMFISAKEIILILIPKYASYDVIIRVFSLVFIFFSTSTLCKISLMSKRWLKPLLYSSAIIVFSDLILNFILVQWWGAIGAAVATLISFVLEFLFFLWFFLKNFSINIAKIISKPVLVYFIMLFPSLFSIENLFLSFTLKILTSLLIGITFLIIFEKQAILELKKILTAITKSKSKAFK